MKQPMMILSAGHTKGSPGATHKGLTEHELNVAYVDSLYLCLRDVLCYDKGLLEDIILLPHEDTLRDKLKTIDALSGDNRILGIEIHFNASGTGKAHGTEVFVSPGDILGHKLGKALLGSLSFEDDNQGEQLLRNRGVKTPRSSARGSLGWVTPKVGSFVLWECCFMDNPEDMLRMPSPDLFGTFATRAIRRFLRDVG